MIALLLPVFAASVAGGLHCLAMCGPFALAARAALVPYHAGRLVTYAALGGAAGVAGHVLDSGGALGGVSRLSAVVAGVFMIVFGVASLFPRRGLVRLGRGPTQRSGWLARVLAVAARRGPKERGFLLGLSTTLIPCGWLYAFVATAAATGAVLPALLVMIAFWLGTLPWLFGASFGLQALVSRFGGRVRRVSGGLVAAAGVFLIVLRTGPLSATPLPAEHERASTPASCPFHGK